jgi:probable F420-dependent oxidoreductase
VDIDAQVKFGIAIPQIWSAPEERVASLPDFLARAEALGYHSAWVQEQILGPTNTYEPVTLLAFAAAATRALRLGTSVLITPLRSPVQLAKSLSTLDTLSGGRLIVGVGIGANTRIYPAFGITPGARVRRFVEGIEVMCRLWTEERVSFEGRFWKLENAAMAPKPLQKPHPPIWFGAREPGALRRAAELGDGWMGAGSSTNAQFKEQVGRLRGYLAEAKRDARAYSIAKRVYVAVDANKGRALERLRQWFGAYYNKSEMADAVCLAGGAAEVAEGLRELRAAGAQLILLNPVYDAMRHLEVLATDVLPQVK